MEGIEDVINGDGSVICNECVGKRDRFIEKVILRHWMKGSMSGEDVG